MGFLFGLDRNFSTEINFGFSACAAAGPGSLRTANALRQDSRPAHRTIDFSDLRKTPVLSRCSLVPETVF